MATTDVGEKFNELHLIKFNLFKEQNPEIGRFDVIFEVEGKLLYAHKLMLTLVSDTFDAMLSERWNTKKDEPIKIESYGYDNFYQFITFLYTAKCQLTETNIFSMVDIAEFYGVALFTSYCDQYLAEMEIATENIFLLMNLAAKFSITRLQARIVDFIENNFTAIIASDGFLKVSKNVAKKLVVAYKYKPEPEDLFRAVFKWSEKQIINAQIANPTLNFNDAIKTEISDFLPHIFFRGMDSKFLQQFVVPRGFIFSSLTELGQILSDRPRFFGGKVKVTNENGQTLHGFVIPDKIVLRNIESLKFLTSNVFSDNFCLWPTNFSRPSAPSSLKKRDDIEWYLFYWSEGRIGVERCSIFGETDYLLAELTPGPTGFETTERCKIEIE